VIKKIRSTAIFVPTPQMDAPINNMKASDSEIRIEPLNRTHADALFDLLQEPALYAHIDDVPPPDRERYRERCTRLENTLAPNGHDRWCNWVVWVGDQMAGYVQCTAYPATSEFSASAEIAYMLSIAFQGKGVALRATQHMLSAVQDAFGVQEFWVTIYHTNAASVRLAQRLGFTEVPASAYRFDNYEPGDVVMRLCVNQ
jgi:[ribosomal protein S5]-alanine N-acetyltransferase